MANDTDDGMSNHDNSADDMGEIFELCSWAEADDDVAEHHGVGDVLEAAGWDPEGTDLFGRPPDVYVHSGDVVIDGPCSMYAQGNGVFILDGSLTVNGPFVFYAHDLHTLLIIAGDLHAHHLVQASDSQLVVKGKTAVDGLLFLDVSDAGFSHFAGPVISRYRVIGNRSAPAFAIEPTGTELPTVPTSTAFRAKFSDQDSDRNPGIEKICEAVEHDIPLID